MSKAELPDAGTEAVAPDAAPALGPGDDDPKSQARGTAGDARKPLGPGDDDGVVVDRGTAGAATPPPAPGDGPESEFDMIAPLPAGPGQMDFGPRRVTLIPKKKAAPVEAPPEPKAESSTRRSRRNGS